MMRTRGERTKVKRGTVREAETHMKGKRDDANESKLGKRWEKVEA